MKVRCINNDKEPTIFQVNGIYEVLRKRVYHGTIALNYKGTSRRADIDNFVDMNGNRLHHDIIHDEFRFTMEQFHPMYNPHYALLREDVEIDGISHGIFYRIGDYYDGVDCFTLTIINDHDMHKTYDETKFTYYSEEDSILLERKSKIKRIKKRINESKVH